MTSVPFETSAIYLGVVIKGFDRGIAPLTIGERLDGQTKLRVGSEPLSRRRSLPTHLGRFLWIAKRLSYAPVSKC
jgi:hypothetical protein